MSGPESLDLVRFELDVIDDQIADLLVARFRRLEQVIAIKRAGGLPAHDPGREMAIAERVARRIAGVDPGARQAVARILDGVVREGREHVGRGVATAP